jgi:hypothetical protein
VLLNENDVETVVLLGNKFSKAKDYVEILKVQEILGQDYIEALRILEEEKGS